VNFARDVVEATPTERRAIVELARDGTRREWRFGEVAEQAAQLHAHLAAQGVRRGEVVLTLLGNRPQWVLAMVACFRAGYAALPCTEQLRPKDLRLRLDVTSPALVVADERNRDALEAAGWGGPTVWAPWAGLPARDAPPPAELAAGDACLVAFTSGTSGEPKAVLHGQRYRVIANRSVPRRIASLRGLVAAGEALDPDVLGTWHEATGLWIRDGYGQTETGQLTGHPPGAAPRPGSMGRPLPGVALTVEDGELTLDPATDPTFFLHYLGEPPHTGPWRTGDLVRADEDRFLYFESRADDVIVSAGYRIGPFEVESALVAHPAVADAAAVSAPDRERGAVVRAIVVLRDGHDPSDALARELQDHVKAETAPYKYPRIVEFAEALPRTSSGKVRRSALRGNAA
jgi:acyl-coenzyme A synthetase/AMP-(fatty) acid ligase